MILDIVKSNSINYSIASKHFYHNSLLHGNLELLVLVLFYSKLVGVLFHAFHDVVWFPQKRMATYGTRTRSQVFQCF